MCGMQVSSIVTAEDGKLSAGIPTPSIRQVSTYSIIFHPCAAVYMHHDDKSVKFIVYCTLGQMYNICVEVPKQH